MATDVAAFEFRPFPGVGESQHLITRITSDMAPFWDGLGSGQLVLQNCSTCGRSRYPAAPVCPYCRTSTFTWKAVSGAGSVFSWIRYHKSYLPEFEPLMPYCVLSVQLDAGPRMFGRFASSSEPSTDMRVTAIGERWADGRILPAFIEE